MYPYFSYILVINFYSSTLRAQNNFSWEVDRSLTKITLSYEHPEGFFKEHAFIMSLNMFQKINQIELLIFSLSPTTDCFIEDLIHWYTT